MPVKQPKKLNIEASTQTHLKIAEIKNNILVLKDGSIRAVLRVSSVNFDLISEQEQNVIIYAFQEFLNFLEFPIQIIIRSKKLDIDGYIENLVAVADNQKDELLKKQTYDYIDYVGKLVELSDIMAKEFYVIVPFEPFRSKKKNPIKKFMAALNPSDTIANYSTRQREFAALKKGLNQRVNSVLASLSHCGVHVQRLNTHELIKLFYEVYNPSISLSEKGDHIEDLNIELPAVSRDKDDDDEKDDS